jgi:hypothetical protein
MIIATKAAKPARMAMGDGNPPSTTMPNATMILSISPATWIIIEALPPKAAIRYIHFRGLLSKMARMVARGCVQIVNHIRFGSGLASASIIPPLKKCFSNHSLHCTWAFPISTTP